MRKKDVPGEVRDVLDVVLAQLSGKEEMRRGVDILARLLATAVSVGIRYREAKPPLEGVRKYIEGPGAYPFSYACERLETHLLEYLGGTYMAAEKAAAMDLPTLGEALGRAEHAAFQLLEILHRAQAQDTPEAVSLPDDYPRNVLLPDAVNAAVQTALAVVAARRSVAREIEAMRPDTAPSYHAARQREYRRRQSNKGKRVRLDIYPEDERLLRQLGFLASDRAANPAALVDALETFLLAAFLAYPGGVTMQARLAAQRKRMDGLGIGDEGAIVSKDER